MKHNFTYKPELLSNAQFSVIRWGMDSFGWVE
jgi:hypothetical protein